MQRAMTLLVGLVALAGPGCQVKAAPAAGEVDAGAARQQEGIETLGASGLLPSADQQRALVAHAMAGELARTLQRLDGIVEARVHLALPRPVPFAGLPGKPARKATASVLLRTRTGRPGVAVTDGQVRRLVAGAVQGLEPARISLMRQAASAGGEPARAADLARVGPFAVAPGSRLGLLITLCVGLALIAGLALLVIVLMRRPPPAPAPAPVDDDKTDLDLDLESSISLLGKSFGRRE